MKRTGPSKQRQWTRWTGPTNGSACVRVRQSQALLAALISGSVLGRGPSARRTLTPCTTRCCAHINVIGSEVKAKVKVKAKAKAKGTGTGLARDDEVDGGCGCMCLTSMAVLFLGVALSSYAFVLAEDLSPSGELPRPCASYCSRRALSQELPWFP